MTVDAQGLPRFSGRGALLDTWLHDAAGRVISQAESGSNATEFTYGTDGRLARALFASEPTVYKYDARGRLKTLTTPDTRILTREYDARSLMTRETYGIATDIRQTAFAYDAEGKLSSRTEAPGHLTDEATTQFLYGPRGELLRVTQPEPGSVWNYDYDRLGRLSAVTPPAGSLRRQTWGYDGIGRPNFHVDGVQQWITQWTDGKATTTATPGLQQLERLTDARGRLLVESVKAVGDSVGSVPVRTFIYDGLDALRQMQEGSRTPSVFGYDTAHRLSTVTRAPEVITYGYDGNSRRLASLNRGGPSSVGYGYDSLNRLDTVTGAWGSPINVDWYPGGSRLLSLTDGTTHEAFGFDARGRLETIDYSPTPNTNRRTYSFDERGNPKTEAFGGVTRSFGYDKADRLTSSTDWAGVLTALKLHPDGTREYEDVGAVRRSYEYSPVSGALESVKVAGTPVAAWTYFANGRVHTRTLGGVTTTLSWDAFGTMVGASIPAQPGVPSVTASYEYDALGLRRRADVNGAVRTWSWVGETQVAEGDELLASVGPYLVAQGDVRFEHDALGSIVGQRRMQQSPLPPITSSAQYGTWGAQSGGTQLTSNAYTGHRREDALGLTQAQQRWLDNDFGVFLSRDSTGAQSYLSTPNGLGPWSYANLSPARYTDPDGRSPMDPTPRMTADQSCGGQGHPGCSDSLYRGIYDADVKGNLAGSVGQIAILCMLAPGCRESLALAGKAFGTAYTTTWTLGLNGHNQQGGLNESIPDPVTGTTAGVVTNAAECIQSPGVTMACGATAMVAVPGSIAATRAVARTNLARTIALDVVAFQSATLESAEAGALATFGRTGAPTVSSSTGQLSSENLAAAISAASWARPAGGTGSSSPLLTTNLFGVVGQKATNGCGAACAEMAAGRLGVTVTQDQLMASRYFDEADVIAGVTVRAGGFETAPLATALEDLAPVSGRRWIGGSLLDRAKNRTDIVQELTGHLNSSRSSIILRVNAGDHWVVVDGVTAEGLFIVRNPARKATQMMTAEELRGIGPTGDAVLSYPNK